MKIVEIKMTEDFMKVPESKLIPYAYKEYYAIDAGEYWLVQEKNGAPFNIVIPKILTGFGLFIATGCKTINSAEVIPCTNIEQEPSIDPDCCPGPNGV